MKQLIYKTRPGYDSRNRCSFNRFLKVSRDGAEVTSGGRSFHMRAPATGKVKSILTKANRKLVRTRTRQHRENGCLMFGYFTTNLCTSVISYL